jgi:hypothetical protein
MTDDIGRERIPVEALSFPGAPSTALSPDMHNTFYANLLRRYLQYGNSIVFDPDYSLDAEPEIYSKIVNELSIASKLRKRSQRVVSAQWRIHTKDQEKLGLCDLLTDVFSRIQGFRRSLKALNYNSTLSGFSTLRIFGSFVTCKLDGDHKHRRWWIPTNLVDVSKQRWRINKEDPLNIERGFAPYFWSVQDVITYQWYRIDAPGAVPGLRRMDYVWAKASEDEYDLGYGHGLSRGIFHRWFMNSHAWIYAMDGAESWSKGKVVINNPNSLGGATIPGDSGLKAQKQAQQIRDDIAAAAAEQLSRHVLVLDSGQEFGVFARPESGHESVKWIIDQTGKDLDEYILGKRPNDNVTWDVDPEIVNGDKNILEEAINGDLMRAIISFNEPNFRALGWTSDQVKKCKFVMQRDGGYDPETIGKSIQIALAAGVPVHRDDVYKGLGLTPVNAGSPDAVWAPQPGQPVSVDLRKPGEGPGDAPRDMVGGTKEGGASPNLGCPSPGGPYTPPPPGNNTRVTL